MNILISGASGFFGKICCAILNGEIVTLGRSKTNNCIVDISIEVPHFGNSFDVVIHSAGKAHSTVKTDVATQDFFNVNVKGTLNLLKGLEEAPSLPKAFVFISSVSVYGLSFGAIINEETPLKATDAYGQSKIQAEQLIQKWCAKNNVICTVLRLPLLVGENPPGNLGAMIKGIQKGYYFNIGGGSAKKSMVIAEDVARFILPVSEVGGIYNLTDGYHPSFSELSVSIATQLGRPKPANIPHLLASIMAKVGDLIGSRAPINSDKLRKITSDLTFDDSKARKLLGWDPTPVLEGFKIH